MALTQQPQDVLKTYWGFDSFRSLQLEIIQSVLDGKDTLALLPTGGGKSICFQVPAMCQEGICIVISPLIALMKDQVSRLKELDIAAEAIYSGMRYKDIDRCLDNCVYGKIKFLYLSPERLKTDIVIERLKKMNVNLLAVDEAHCISQWGYDFRPSYLEIAAIRELLPEIPVIALTATATSEVSKDIQEKLEFNPKKSEFFQKSFERSNLCYVVLQEEGKARKLLEILNNVKGSGIVYVRSRRRTKEVADFLNRRGISSDFYHGGLQGEQRSDKQERWIKNELRIMVATNAFGMGIDKPDVRVVVHLELPDSLEAYFQEAGRGGRDGEKAYAVLLYQPQDKQSLERKFKMAFPEMSKVREVYQALGSFFQLATGGGLGKSFDFDINQFVKNYNLQLQPTYHCLRILEKEGWIVMTETVYTPSSLKVIVSREVLYQFLISNRKMDALLKTILRTYQGASQHYVNIRERQLAGFLKIPITELVASLESLQKSNIIDYRPQKDDPQLIFLQERVSQENLTIDRERFDFRKNRQLERITKTIAYASEVICRSQQLLFYFGEKEAKACGQCDVCLGRTKSTLSKEEFESLQQKIKRLLKADTLRLEEVVDSFSPKRRNQVLRALEYLIDEGVIDRKDDVLVLKESE